MNAVAVAPLSRLPYAHDVYDYVTPEPLGPGRIVTVPFRNRLITGVVIETPQFAAKPRKLLSLERVHDGFALPAEMLAFFHWMRERYGVGYGVLLATLFSFFPRDRDSLRNTHDGPGTIPQGTAIESLVRWKQITTSLSWNSSIAEFVNTHSEKQILILFPNVALLERAASANATLHPLVVHSGISQRTLGEIGRAVANGNAACVFATRVGLFMPWTDLRGIALTHENHEDYKALLSAPRYHTRDAAMALARCWGAEFLALGTLPSLSMWTVVQSAKHFQSATTSLQPPRVIDMRGRPYAERFVSHELVEIILESLRGKQSVLLIHERLGTITTLRCATCGWLARCAFCNAALLSGPRALRCSSCKSEAPLSLSCPQCANRTLIRNPGGIERIKPLLEAEFQKQFPNNPPAVQILSKGSELDVVREKLPMIVLATSYAFDRMEELAGMIHPLGLGAVLSIDGVLARGVFDSGEDVFARLSEFGFSCSTLGAKAYVQTRFPEHHALKALAENNPDAFYDYEQGERERFGFPPAFARLSIEPRKTIPSLKRDIARLASEMDVVTAKTMFILRCPFAQRDRMNAVQSALLDRFPGKLSITQL